MEREIFTWSGWDKDSTSEFVFYGCVLVKNFGGFLKKGDTFDMARLSYDTGILEFFELEHSRKTGEGGTYKIKHRFQLELLLSQVLDTKE